MVGLLSSAPAYSSPSGGAGPVRAATTTPDPDRHADADATPTPSPTPTATDDDCRRPDDLLRPDVVALPAEDLSHPGPQRRPPAAVLVVAGQHRARARSRSGRTRTSPCPAGQHNSTQIIYRDANGNGIYEPRQDTGIARHRAGCMIYHPLHHHWHFKASARYTLLDPARRPSRSWSRPAAR